MKDVLREKLKWKMRLACCRFVDMCSSLFSGCPDPGEHNALGHLHANHRLTASPAGAEVVSIGGDAGGTNPKALITVMALIAGILVAGAGIYVCCRKTKAANVCVTGRGDRGWVDFQDSVDLHQPNVHGIRTAAHRGGLHSSPKRLALVPPSASPDAGNDGVVAVVQSGLAGP